MQATLTNKTNKTNPMNPQPMTTITKLCKSLAQAERYQNKLYNQFDSVKLILAPMFSEEGLYAWSISKAQPIS